MAEGATASNLSNEFRGVDNKAVKTLPSVSHYPDPTDEPVIVGHLPPSLLSLRKISTQMVFYLSWSQLARNVETANALTAEPSSYL